MNKLYLLILSCSLLLGCSFSITTKTEVNKEKYLIHFYPTDKITDMKYYYTDYYQSSHGTIWFTDNFEVERVLHGTWQIERVEDGDKEKY